MKKLISTLFIALTTLAFALPAAAAPQSGSTGAKSQAPLVVASKAKAKKVKPAAAKPAAKAKKAKHGKAKKAAKTKKAKPGKTKQTKQA